MAHAQPFPARAGLAAIALSVLLAGCAGGGGFGTVAATPAGAAGAPSYQPVGVTPGQSTGTAVGAQVEQLRGELAGIQAAVAGQYQRLQDLRGLMLDNANRYHGRVAAISTRLQIGTTPGNPELVAEWAQAQAELETVAQAVDSLNMMVGEVAGTSAATGYLLATTRAAYGIYGAVDEDHRQLAVIEDEASQTVVQIDRMLAEVTEDIGRQAAFVGRERNNLWMLSGGVQTGELYGRSLATAAYGSGVPLAAPLATPALAGRPLMVIRFERGDVDFQQALYTAATAVIDQRPDAAFQLVAVAPSQVPPAQMALDGNDARRRAEAVRQSLAAFGIPPQRVQLSEAASPAAIGPEVHGYVR